MTQINQTYGSELNSSKVETSDENLAQHNGIATVFDGVVTGAAVILAFGAFDDITTDNATSFEVEYSCLVLCLIWMAALIARLAKRGLNLLALLCAMLVLAILWGQRQIGPGTTASWQLEYVLATTAIIGIFLVACGLIVKGLRLLRAQPPKPTDIKYA
jgi:hypothetical protein